MVRFWNAGTVRRLAQVVVLVFAGAMLSGCIIVPEHGPRFYHPYYYR